MSPTHTPRPFPEPAPYDSELPILAELESEYRTELLSVEIWAGRPARTVAAPHHPAARAARRRDAPHRELAPARITRRALLLVALVSLVGASALAGTAVFGGAHHPSAGAEESGASTNPVLLDTGGTSVERWQLQSYNRGGTTCYALFIAETLASACAAAPARAGVLVGSALGPTRRLVAGLAGPGVAQVLVRVGGHTSAVPTHPLPRTAGGAAGAAGARARGSRLPPGVLWFVASFPGESSLHAAPAHVTPRDADGRALGPATLDCSLGGTSPACRRAAANIASR
ncbi:MAG: hypothetical protein FWD42_06640 [Solirubrobacterales bacterium]|nr:hypothetical protein [Solirubrobacterales bacterium]